MIRNVLTVNGFLGKYMCDVAVVYEGLCWHAKCQRLVQFIVVYPAIGLRTFFIMHILKYVRTDASKHFGCSVSQSYLNFRKCYSYISGVNLWYYDYEADEV